MAFLEVDSVVAGYGFGPDILNGVSLKVEEGSCYCVIGPNGAGKSTLLNAIAGVLEPRSGEVRFKGEVLNGLRPDQVLARGVSLIPQDRSLFPDMSVRENMVMGGYVERDRKALSQRLEEVYELFPVIKERTSQRARTLSGGEQQMVALARAMMLRPHVLLIDEPSLGLAPKMASLIFDTITRLKSLGMTIVLVEQNARRGLQVAESGVVLDLGEFRFQGPSDQILSDPRIRELYLGRSSFAQEERT
jgi:branched-chain amino acid transport system ATP-binding protein